MTTLWKTCDPGALRGVTDLDGESQRAARQCEILFFAKAADLAATRSAKIEVHVDMTLGGLRGQLVAHFPQLRSILPFCALAGDGIIVSDAEKIGDIQVIAVLPPVSGG